VVNTLARAAALALGFLCVAASAAVGDPTSITVIVGGQHITLPAPATQVEITANREQVRRFFETITPEVGRSLAAFAPPEDVGLMEKGLHMTCWAAVFSIRELESQTIGELDFQELRSVMRSSWEAELTQAEAEADTELAKASDRISREFSVDMAFSTNDIVPVKVFQDDEDSFGTIMRTRSEIRTATESLQIELVTTTTLLRVKDRVLVLNYYLEYSDLSVIEAASIAASQWTAAIRAANLAP
jgi:hypothetical protein